MEKKMTEHFSYSADDLLRLQRKGFISLDELRSKLNLPPTATAAPRIFAISPDQIGELETKKFKYE